MGKWAQSAWSLRSGAGAGPRERGREAGRSASRTRTVRARSNGYCFSGSNRDPRGPTLCVHARRSELAGGVEGAIRRYPGGNGQGGGSLTEETMPETFDYIVAGAGSAGCVIAARLSENPKHRLLLLQAGPKDT